MLAALLSFRHSHAASKKLKTNNLAATVSRFVDPPYDELVIYHLKCLYALEEKKLLEAFQNQYELTQSFVKVFQSQKEENWMLKVMQIVCLELRLLASPADKQANNKKHPIECLEKTAKCLMACFRICAADKWVKFFIVIYILLMFPSNFIFFILVVHQNMIPKSGEC